MDSSLPILRAELSLRFAVSRIPAYADALVMLFKPTQVLHNHLGYSRRVTSIDLSGNHADVSVGVSLDDSGASMVCVRYKNIGRIVRFFSCCYICHIVLFALSLAEINLQVIPYPSHCPGQR